MSESKLKAVAAAAGIYGDRSFDNYAQIRSVAEQLRNGFCEWLDATKKCVFLVPPQGPFTAQNYGSAAYSVSGKGFLPLEPLSFGLAIRISGSGDFMRLVLTCRKEGSRMHILVEDDTTYTIDLPVEDKSLIVCFEGLYKYLLNWFSERVDRYDNGNYGSNDIGFDIQRIEE